MKKLFTAMAAAAIAIAGVAAPTGQAKWLVLDKISVLLFVILIRISSV